MIVRVGGFIIIRSISKDLPVLEVEEIGECSSGCYDSMDFSISSRFNCLSLVAHPARYAYSRITIFALHDQPPKEREQPINVFVRTRVFAMLEKG